MTQASLHVPDCPDDDAPAQHNVQGRAPDSTSGSGGERLQRALLRLPDPADWRAATGATLATAFDRLAAIDGARLATRLACVHGAERPQPPVEPKLWRALSHPLSTQALQRSGTQHFDAGRTLHEAEVCARIVAPLYRALAHADARDFIDVVEHIGRGAGNGSGFRTRAVALRGDATGARMRFPHHRHIQRQLSDLQAYIRRHRARDPLFVILVAMIAITNLHPFLDANGRSSRILGNALLRIASPRPLDYLPFYEVFWQSSHGWEIRVRLAEICHDWRPVCAYLVDLVDVACDLAPRSVPRGGT